MVIHIDKQESEQVSEQSILADKDVEEYRVHGKNNSAEWSGYWDLSPSKWNDWLGYFICFSQDFRD